MCTASSPKEHWRRRLWGEDCGGGGGGGGGGGEEVGVGAQT